MGKLRLAASCLSVALVLGVAFVRPADAAPRWAKASQATIHPGVQVISESGQCTANFVFYDSKDVYIGMAAHCTSLGGQTDTNGCKTPARKVPTRVQIEGARRTGYVVYNSWKTMQKVGELRGDRCLDNDFALIKINSADRSRVNPSIPFWGGPTGYDTSAPTGEAVYSYGDSGLRFEVSALSPKKGVATDDYDGGWAHGIYTASPGIPGDSGSAVLGSRGGALGVLSTIQSVPPGENIASDLYRAVRYMKDHTSKFDRVKLAKGTERFQPLP